MSPEVAEQIFESLTAPAVEAPLVATEIVEREKLPSELLERLYRLLELARSSNPNEASNARERVAGMLSDRAMLDALADFVRSGSASVARAEKDGVYAQLVEAASAVDRVTAIVADNDAAGAIGAADNNELGWMVAMVMSTISLGWIGPIIVMALRRGRLTRVARRSGRVRRGGFG